MSQAEERIVKFEQYLKRDPGNVTLRLDLARACYQGGELRRAAELYAALRGKTEDTPAFLNEMASVQLALGHWAEAAALLRLAVAKDPAAPLHYNLGFAELADGNTRAGVDHLKIAAQQQPDNNRFNYSLARGYYQLGELREAHAAISRVLAQDPSDGEALVLAGFIDLERGELAAAARQAETAATQNWGQILRFPRKYPFVSKET